MPHEQGRSDPQTNAVAKSYGVLYTKFYQLVTILNNSSAWTCYNLPKKKKTR